MAKINPEVLIDPESTLRCGYCNLFSSGKTFKSGDMVYRKCIARHKKVDFDHKICKYFDPVKTFHCERHGERIPLAICLHRRMNYQNLNKLVYCRKCRQFDRELSGLVGKYIIEGSKINKFNSSPDESNEPQRKLARRKTATAKRSLKRRTSEKRVLKRRKNNSKRKIKRRS
jgi:hypothetical protein